MKTSDTCERYKTLYSIDVDPITPYVTEPTMQPIDILGYGAGILVVFSLIPQTVKPWKTKSTSDLSLWRYIIYLVGLVLWIAYAVIIRNGPVAIMNGLGLILASIILFLKIRYK